ncbi:hypothetical protein BTR22_11220 [Alkalihalophilus pseudofirmus]|uniref:hypothetical protein n=1 Tax=Alkalihalophilus pseudofirmus TaxID=79885 RepID=UPI0009515CF5|nr:hypothetical protein BTR22_11220 [Alkalihalophilus pseudofirmus]
MAVLLMYVQSLVVQLQLLALRVKMVHRLKPKSGFKSLPLIFPHARTVASAFLCPAAAPCPAGKNGVSIETKKRLRIAPPYFTA